MARKVGGYEGGREHKAVPSPLLLMSEKVLGMEVPRVEGGDQGALKRTPKGDYNWEIS